VDFLVKFSPDVSFRDYDLIENSFSALLGRGVDIVSSSVLPNAPRFANRVCREAVAI
jgi:predicted nucleotidyltransferase